jgi:predicted GH43/DUF377 family glycosyl hydrolase
MSDLEASHSESCEPQVACNLTQPGVAQSGIMLESEPSRVALRPFVPGDNPFPTPDFHASRLERVVRRVLSLDDHEVADELARVRVDLASRHRAVEATLERRFHNVCPPTAPWHSASHEQRLLIGAYFTEEYSFEAVSLFNPSIVAHPDQSGLPAGSVRFVLPLRAIGEGHISSITFRTGQVDASNAIHVDPPSKFAISPAIELVPGGFPDDPGVRLTCHDHEDLSEVVLFPVSYRQRHGLEDLRLTRFVEDNGTVEYLGTYTAVGGETIRQELLRTSDFATFELTALQGKYAATKGMALFPRRIDGNYVMLGRQDHENIWVLRSNQLLTWDSGQAVVEPRWPWEFVQLGSCGPPIELAEGWLAITHGVGSVRNYCLGACLLNRDDPFKLLARTREPLIVPSCVGRQGYVPNVTYSCGGLLHGRTLVLPFAVADLFATIATIDVDWLLGVME